MARIVESFAMSEKAKPPYWEMGQRIIAAREKLTELDQAAMTEALGLKDPTYGNYERGNRKIPPHIMEKFQKITGCSADWVYLGTGPMVEDPWLKEAANVLSKVSNDSRESLMNVLLNWPKS